MGRRYFRLVLLENHEKTVLNLLEGTYSIQKMELMIRTYLVVVQVSNTYYNFKVIKLTSRGSEHIWFNHSSTSGWKIGDFPSGNLSCKGGHACRRSEDQLL